MPFTYKSTPVQRESIYQAIPDELLLMGAKTKYDRAEKFANELGSVYNSFFGINTYGKDAEVLQQKAAQATDLINKLSRSGFASLESQSQINNLIGQMSNDPDILAIHQRANFYNNELKHKQEAEEKGRTYVSPSLEALTNYYSGDSYYRKPEGFNMNSGFLSPDLIKLQKTAQELTPKKKKWVTLSNGERMQIEYQDANDLKNNYYNLIGQDPNGQKYLNYNFEKNYPLNWEVEGRNKLAQDINKLQNEIYDINSTGGDSSAHQAELQRLTKLYDSGATGEALKHQMFKTWVDNFTSDWADGVSYVNEGDIKLDELNKIKMEHAFRMSENIQKQLLPGLSALGLTNKSISQLTPDEIKQAAAKTQELAIEAFKSKEDIKQDNKEQLIEKQIQAKGIKGTTPKEANDLISKLDSGYLEGKDLTKVNQLISQNRAYFGLDEDSDIKNVKVSNGKVTFEQDVSGLDFLKDEVEEIPVSKIREFLVGKDANDNDPLDLLK